MYIEIIHIVTEISGDMNMDVNLLKKLDKKGRSFVWGKDIYARIAL